MEFKNQLKDNFCLVEEGAEGEVPFENRKSMDTIPIDTTLVINATCTPQEMGASQFKNIFSSKVNLLEDNLKVHLLWFKRYPPFLITVVKVACLIPLDPQNLVMCLKG